MSLRETSLRHVDVSKILAAICRSACLSAFMFCSWFSETSLSALMSSLFNCYVFYARFVNRVDVFAFTRLILESFKFNNYSSVRPSSPTNSVVTSIRLLNRCANSDLKCSILNEYTPYTPSIYFKILFRSAADQFCSITISI